MICQPVRLFAFLLGAGLLLTACETTRKPVDASYENLKLYRDTPGDLKPQKRTELLDKSLTRDFDTIWLPVMQNAIAAQIKLPERHLARYETRISDRFAGRGGASVEDVNVFLAYLIKSAAIVERPNERLLELYRKAYPPAASAPINLSFEVYQDALKRLADSVKSEGEKARVGHRDAPHMISARVNYLRMFADNIDGWRARYPLGAREQRLLDGLLQYILRNLQTPEEAQVKKILRKLDPERYRSVFTS